MRSAIRRPLSQPGSRDGNPWLSERLFRNVLDDDEFGVNAEAVWPPIDVYHDASMFYVRVELPGVELKDVDVRVQEPHLVVEGERRLPEGNYHRVECVYGRFSRIVHLPDTVDFGKIDAKLSNGVLTVSFPVKDSVKPRAIPISTK